MSETIQIYTLYTFQIILAITLINVWLIHFSKSTKFRAKGAINMKDEFRIYGLSESFMYVVGFSKLLISAAFIIGFWIPSLVYFASLFLAVLMLGAVAMHIKVRDSIVRTLPAATIFLIALINIILIKF